MKLQLYLDESGMFRDTTDSKFNPSLVGGLLTTEEKINAMKAQKMIYELTGKSKLHCNEEPAETIIAVLQGILKTDSQFVIFENTERLQIIDCTTTYLNIIAEGIINLMVSLAATYEKLHLDIIIAYRKDMMQEHGIIEQHQYIERIRERIIVGLARKKLSKTRLPSYKITFEDAGYYHPLMLADAICNAYLTRTAPRKFSDEQRSQLQHIYANKWLYSMAESVKGRVQSYIINGKYADALMVLLEEHEQELLEEYAQNHLTQFNSLELSSVLQEVAVEFDHLISVQRQYGIAKPILEHTQREFFPLIEQLQLRTDGKFVLDVILYLYTIYTHEGSDKANEQDELFQQKMHSIKDILTKLEYYIIYANRKAVHELNFQNSDEAVRILNELIPACQNLLELIELIEPFQRQRIEQFEQLGKLLGTRGQAYTQKINDDNGYLDLAIADFELALTHFSATGHKDRQYTYIANAYLEAGNVNDALRALIQTEPTEANIEQCLRQWVEKIGHHIFKINIYIKIINAMQQSSSETISSATLYKLLTKSGFNVHQMLKTLDNQMIHPLQSICWGLANYFKSINANNRAKEFLQLGINTLQKCTSDDVMLLIMRVAMYADLYHLTKTDKTKQAFVIELKEIIRLLNLKGQTRLMHMYKFDNILLANGELDDKVITQLIEKAIKIG